MISQKQIGCVLAVLLQYSLPKPGFTRTASRSKTPFPFPAGRCSLELLQKQFKNIIFLLLLFVFFHITFLPWELSHPTFLASINTSHVTLLINESNPTSICLMEAGGYFSSGSIKLWSEEGRGVLCGVCCQCGF